MRLAVKIVVSVFLFASIAAAQETSRERTLRRLVEMNGQIRTLEDEFLLPDAADAEAARAENFNVFRLMPREKFDGKFIVEGGGSYFSFTTRSHDYQKIAQINFEQNNLKVGFAGADYGFISDLGDVPLADVTKQTARVNFLLDYKPPTAEPEIRREQRKARDYEANGAVYKSSLPAVVGHCYVLRAISFRSADVLVAFKVHRKDADGSLIIFWKSIENFEKPLIARN